MYGGYSICLNKWALDPEIKNELGLLLIISSLTAEKGYCYASNQHLAEVFKTTEVSISRKLKKLNDKGYIDVEYEKKGCQITSRKIRLTKMLTDDYQKCYSTINKNVKENNISNINNISNKKENIKRKSFNKPTLEEIIEYCKERQNNVDAKHFFDFYEAGNWSDSNGNKVKNWKQKVISWEKRDKVTKIENKGELPEWWDKDFKEDEDIELKRKAEAIRNGTYRA